jgi:MFS family permease
MQRPVQERPTNGIRQAPWPLLALNFFMADIQAGIGPFLGVFLLAHGWNSGYIGTVMTVGGAAGMFMTAPAGAFIDQTHNKRGAVIVAGICAVIASAVVLVSQTFWVIAVSQVGSAVAGAAVVPAVNAITLGIVRQRGFNRQNGRNQAFNHAGNMVGAALSGLVGWTFGYPAIFVLAAVFGTLSIASVLLIPPDLIDYGAARGLNEDKEGVKVSGYRVLIECGPLMVLAAALLAFHLGNAAMLPLYGMAVVEDAHANGPGFVALTVVVAQATMVLASVIAWRLAESKGYWLVLLISFIALPFRGIVAAYLLVPWGSIPFRSSMVWELAYRASLCRGSSRAFSTAQAASTWGRARS